MTHRAHTAGPPGRLAGAVRRAVAAAVLLAAAGRAAGAVPAPAETPVELVVSGRTSTLKSIRIVKTGRQVPPNFSDGRVKNTPGYSWYVSRHYALKTDMPEAWARRCLTWAELAYPHAVRIIGREPDGIETRRMVFVYGRDLRSMREATYTDGGFRWRHKGGGVTFDFLRAAYNYPSGSLTYHKRDLVIHENLHLLQACVTGSCSNMPFRFLEGIAYAFANHVYDRRKRQLTVCVLDKPTVNNPYDTALEALAKRFVPIDEFLESDQTGPLCALYTQFMWTDPDRLMKWRLWRDGMLALHGRNTRDADRRLMKAVYGDLDRLNDVWKRWVRARRSSFHYVDWGWEQVGSTLWSYGWPQKTPFSQTNICLPLGEKARGDPLVMDYPAEPVPSHLVGPVKRGGAEPAVGAVLDFSRNPGRGLCGLAFGVMPPKRPARLPRDAPGQVNVYVQAGSTFVLDGRQLGLKKVEAPLPDGLRAAVRADGHRAGLTVTVAAKELRAELRAGAPGAVKAASAALDLTDDARQRILTGPSAVIARDGYHGVTPFFDAARPMPPDLTAPAPANRWRFAGEQATYRLYRAAWKMGTSAPASLLSLKRRMAAAMGRNAAAQAAALAEHKAKFPRVVRDVRGLADRRLAQVGTAELLGLSLRLRLGDRAAAGRLTVAARLHGPADGAVRGHVTFRAGPGGTASTKPIRAAAGETAVVEWSCAKPAEPSPLPVRARAELDWQGVKLALEADRVAYPSVPAWWVAGPFSNYGGAATDLAHPVEKGPIDLKASYRGRGARAVRWQRVERPADAPPDAEHVVRFGRMFGGIHAAAYALVWLDSDRDRDAVLAVGSDDGVAVRLNGRGVHKHLRSRAYRTMEDEVPVRLRKGRNELLVKITQATGDWKFSAHLLDKHGAPLAGVRYVPAPSE